MSDVYTTTGDLSSVQDAYNRRAFFQLRPLLLFDQVADVKPEDQAMPGDVVKFTIYDEMDVATSALNESNDVDAVALGDNQVSVTLVERGNAAVTTAKLIGTSFLQVEKNKSNLVNYNAGVSQDTLARLPLEAGSNVLYAKSAGGRSSIVPTDTLTATKIREVRARLAGNSAMPFADGYYTAYIHPDVAVDLHEESGGSNWRDPHIYSQPGEIWRGDTGAFEGFRFIETSRARIFEDAGSSTTLTDVYQTYFCGQQALAKAWSTAVSGPMAQVVIGPVVDKLKRFHSLGWYWLGGYGRFREESLYRIESASSIGDNS